MSTTNLSAYNADRVPHAGGMKFDIIVSDWNSEVTFALCKGAVETLKKHGAFDKDIRVFHVPGSFELVYAAKKSCQCKDVDAVIVLGSVVRGGTPHFDYVCQGTTNGIAALNAEGVKPVIFGLLTTDNMQQALDYGNRILMMDGGEIIMDISGEEKQRLTLEDLAANFRKIKNQSLTNDNIVLQ